MVKLRESTVRQMAELLEKTNSSYFNVFKEMFRDVVAGKRAAIVAIYVRPSSHPRLYGATKNDVIVTIHYALTLTSRCLHMSYMSFHIFLSKAP